MTRKRKAVPKALSYEIRLTNRTHPGTYYTEGCRDIGIPEIFTLHKGTLSKQFLEKAIKHLRMSNIVVGQWFELGDNHHGRLSWVSLDDPATHIPEITKTLPESASRSYSILRLDVVNDDEEVIG